MDTRENAHNGIDRRTFVRSTAAVLRANEAIQKGIKVKFKESDFKV